MLKQEIVEISSVTLKKTVLIFSVKTILLSTKKLLIFIDFPFLCQCALEMKTQVQHLCHEVGDWLAISGYSMASWTF